MKMTRATIGRVILLTSSCLLAAATPGGNGHVTNVCGYTLPLPSGFTGTSPAGPCEGVCGSSWTNGSCATPADGVTRVDIYGCAQKTGGQSCDGNTNGGVLLGSRTSPAAISDFWNDGNYCTFQLDILRPTPGNPVGLRDFLIWERDVCDSSIPVCNCPNGWDYLGNPVHGTLCGQTVCGADFQYYSCQTSGWRAEGGVCPISPCDCPNGRDHLGNPVHGRTCGETVCGADYHYYSCQTTGWRYDGGLCNVPNTCTCDGTNNLGQPVHSETCNDFVCGADYQYYSCTNIGWQPVGGACGCSCPSGFDYAGNPVSSNTCDDRLCSIGYAVYTCEHGGWTPNGDTCFSDDSELDLLVQYIKRIPELDYVPLALDPYHEGWPLDGDPVVWRGHIRNRGSGSVTTQYVWVLDGSEEDSGFVTVPGNGMATIFFHRPWDRTRHTLELILDRSNSIPEREEQNNALLIYTDAISIGFYIERALYDHFDLYQRNMIGTHSNSFEDYAQNNVRDWNQKLADAIYPLTPNGVLDRLRIDEIHVVDEDLPLVEPVPDLPGSNFPNLADYEVDLMWGFEDQQITRYFRDITTASPSNPFYIDPPLLHELGHARYLVDVYAFNVHASGTSTMAISECGAPVANTPFMPILTEDYVYLTPQLGLMNAQTRDQYDFVDEYSAFALNLIAGHRAINGNYNAPWNIGSFLEDLPLENRLVLLDRTGRRLSFASVEIYQSSTTAASDYRREFDDIPDLSLTADANGEVLLGQCPFHPVLSTCVSPFAMSNGVIVVRVELGGEVGYGFLDITAFNLEYWRGDTFEGQYALVFNLQSGCESGCSDGAREGFTGSSTIASCAGEWSGVSSLRASATSIPCGDDLGVECAVAADLCAPGWHICASDGRLDDLFNRIGPTACADFAGSGQFVAAASHGFSNTDGDCSASPTGEHACFDGGWGSEPLCCGTGCLMGICNDAVWPDQTMLGGGFVEGCNQFSSATADGVLCCRD